MHTATQLSSFPARRSAASLLSACRLGLVVAVAALLTACASPLATHVTNFNRWPADAAGASFSFLAPTAPASELELSTYQSYVQTALEQQGLKRVAPGQRARLQVEMTAVLNAENRTVLVPVYQDGYVFVPPWRDAYGRVYGGGWGPSPWGPQYVGDQAVNRTLQVASLKVRVLDTQQAEAATGATPAIFESTARHEGTRGDLPTLMPYLVRSVFDGFPGRNGEVRIVRFDIKTGELLANKP